MNEKESIENSSSKEIVFKQRLDFYWQSIALYSIALIIYSFLIGTIDKSTFSIKILDPVVILLCIFIVATSLVLLINVYKKKVVIIGNDYIIFKSRFREKRYSLSEILKISITREKVGRIQDALRIIRISLTTRKSPIIIRNSSFNDDEQLLNEFLRLRRIIRQTRTDDLEKKGKTKIRLKKNLFKRK